VGRAVDRTLGTNTTGANPAGTSIVTPGATTTGTTTATTTAPITTGAGTGAMAVDSTVMRSGRRASRIIGSNIYNENNESIGEVEDILIPQLAGAGSTPMGSPVAIISVGGFLGIGAKLVAVPYERLQLNTERNRWMLTGATKDSLNALPTFSYDTIANERRG
jgi:sporulation protein YlmC with PRC-barrel domain